MKKNLLRRKDKTPRQEKFLSEIDRLVSWDKLARCAEPCLNEISVSSKVERASLECLVRMTVLNRCFGLSTDQITGAYRPETEDLPGQEEVDSFIQIIERCSLRERIMRELNAQLSKVGISLGRQAASALM